MTHADAEERMRNELRLLQRSFRTEQVYLRWLARFLLHAGLEAAAAATVQQAQH